MKENSVQSCIAWSLDHFIRSVQYRLWDRQADLLRCLQINHQLEFRRLLHCQIRGLSSLQDLVNVGGRVAVQVVLVRAVGHKPPSLKWDLDYGTPEEAERIGLLVAKKLKEEGRLLRQTPRFLGFPRRKYQYIRILGTCLTQISSCLRSHHMQQKKGTRISPGPPDWHLNRI